jgi:hypothetical protein
MARMAQKPIERALQAAGQELAVIHGDNVEFGVMARAAVLAFLRKMPDEVPISAHGWIHGVEMVPSRMIAAIEGE